MTPDLISRAGVTITSGDGSPARGGHAHMPWLLPYPTARCWGRGRSTLWSSSNQPSAPLASSVSVGAEQLFESVDVV